MEFPRNLKTKENVVPQNKTAKIFNLDSEEFFYKNSETNSENNNVATFSPSMRGASRHKESSKDMIFNKSRSSYFTKLVYKMKELNNKSFTSMNMDSLIKFILHFLGNCINILAVLIYMIETCYDNSNLLDKTQVLNYLEIFQISCCFYFIFEYFLSFTQIKKNGILRKILSIDTLIDILSIVPTVIIYFSKSSVIGFLRILRIFRVFRIMRLYRAIKLLKIENSKLDESEQDHHLKFNPVKVQFFTILIVLVCVFFIGAGIVLALQDLIEGAWTLKEMNFFDAIYFMIITYTSVGYGEVSPTHIISRFFIIIGLFCLIIIISDQMSKMASLLAVWGSTLKQCVKIDHFIVVANLNVKLEIFLKEIRERDLIVPILILSKDIKYLPSKNYPFYKVDLWTVSDFDLETFERANTRYARAIFIFCHKVVTKCDQEEKINDFLTLKLNRYFSNIPICLQTLYSEGSFSNDLKKSNKNNSNKLITTIPIMRIKSLILAKASFVKGFPTFIQNLMLNNKELPDQSNNFSSLISTYMKGCQNKIYIKKIPKFFNKKMFFDACHMLYFKSIKNFFVEINSLDTEYCPILFIGVSDYSKKMIYKKESILIFPSRKYIKVEFMDGIFLCNSESELDKVLTSFENFDNNLLNDIRDSRLSAEINHIRNLSSGNLNSLKNLNSDSECKEGSDEDDENKNQKINNGNQNLKEDFNLYKKRSFTRSLFTSSDKISNILDKKISENNNSKTEEDEIDGKDFKKTELIRIQTNSSKNIKEKYFKLKNQPTVDFQINYNTHHLGKEKIEKITNQNMKFMQQAEQNEVFNFVKAFDQTAFKRYGALTILNQEKELHNLDPGKFVENRIYDLDKNSISKYKHIVIVGVQDGMRKLLNLLTNHFPTTDICIFSNIKPEEKNIFKLLKLFKNLYYFKGNSGNPQHLLNAGINKSLFCIFLTEILHSKTDEDMGKILSYRSIEYFFNTNMILEVWHSRSLKFLGYQPLHCSLNLSSEEFLHPAYMAGRVVLVSHLDKLIVDKYFNPNIVEAWMAILTLGFSSSSTNMGYQTLIKENAHFPVSLTIDVPSEYVGKEYHSLVNDLLLLDNPAICLGLYIESPLEYTKKNSYGRVRKLTRNYTALKITNSYKRTMMNKIVLDKVEQSYKTNMNIIRETSYNDQVILDYVDINKNHLPMFLSNPSPGFIIGENCKAMVFYFFNHTNTSDKMTDYNRRKQRKSSKFFTKSNSIIVDQEKNKVNHSQQTFFTILENLKIKATKKYEESLKKIDTARHSNFRDSVGLNI